MLEKMAEKSEVSRDNVVSLIDKKRRPVPSMTALAKIDPDVKAFLKLIHEEDLRLKAIELLNKAIAKAPRQR